VSITATVIVGDLQARAEAAARRATEIVLGELEAAFQQSFTAKAWQWPRDLPTRKLNGATLREKLASYRRGEGVRAGNPRNLIDFGNLRQSGSFRMSGPYEGTYRWSANYASFVHEGGWIYAWGNKRRRVYIPPRPWTRAVLGQEIVNGIRPFPLGKRLKDVWLVHLKASR
jgi:hypothetical protein